MQASGRVDGPGSRGASESAIPVRDGTWHINLSRSDVSRIRRRVFRRRSRPSSITALARVRERRDPHRTAAPVPAPPASAEDVCLSLRLASAPSELCRRRRRAAVRSPSPSPSLFLVPPAVEISLSISLPASAPALPRPLLSSTAVSPLPCGDGIEWRARSALPPSPPLSPFVCVCVYVCSESDRESCRLPRRRPWRWRAKW